MTAANLTRPSRYDAAIIGAGSAGLAFARKARSFGKRVVIVEKSAVGGTCVNRGCVPKKLLWHLAHWQAHTQRLAQSGLIKAAPNVCVEAAMARIQGRTSTLSGSICKELEEDGISILRGDCVLGQTGSLTVGDTSLEADAVVVATGASPVDLDIPGGELLLTSDDVFRWDTLPQNICLIGGGYIGTELSFILSSLGATVTMIEHSDRILDGFDPHAAQMIHDRLKARGIAIRTGDGVSCIQRQGHNQVGVETESGWSEVFDAAINVTGRAPNQKLLEDAGIKLRDIPDASIPLFRETDQPNIFVIGDAAGVQQLTPVARFQGDALAVHLYGEAKDLPLPQTSLTTAVFADPPLAEVRKLRSKTASDANPAHSNTFDDLIEGILDTHEKRPFYMSRGVTQAGGERLTMIADSAPEALQLFTAIFESEPDLGALKRKSRIHPTTTEEWFELAEEDA